VIFSFLFKEDVHELNQISMSLHDKFAV